jgi:hypothetical protein
MQMSISAMDNPTASEGNCLQDYFKYYESEASDSEKSLDGIESSNSTAFAQVFELTSPGSTKCKKRKSTFADYKDEKLQYLAITESLQSLKLAAHWCCKLLCFSWLSTNLVLFCREKYLLIESSKGRREWLERRLSEMEAFENTRLMYAYYLESPDGQNKRCCHAAWDFSYGVSRPTRENASRRRKNSKLEPTMTSRENSMRNRRKGTSARQMFMVSWLKQFAKQCGDILPFGDSNHTEIRLPFGNKQLVHQAYFESIENDCTNLQSPLTYEDFVSVWKNRKDLSHIKCSKYKPGFAKCDKCSEYNKLRKKQLDEVQKKAALLQFQPICKKKEVKKNSIMQQGIKLYKIQIDI